MPDPHAEQIANAYLKNVANRGMFERQSCYGEVIGGDASERDVVNYLLSPQWPATARDELASTAPRWERVLRAPVRRALDAGSGPGITTLALAERYPDAEVVGIDIEAPALDLALHLARDQPRCRFELVAIAEFRDIAGFDVIQCREVIEHVFEPAAAVAKLVSLLRPGGVAYLEMPNYLWPWEPHLRLPMLPRSPKVLLATQCRVTGRNPEFIKHLNFECNPLAVKRWIGSADRDVEVIDLMAEKVNALFNGDERATVPSRARIVDFVRRWPAAARVAERALKALPITPSVMLVVARPPRAS